MNYERLWAPWRLEYVSRGEADETSNNAPEPNAWLESADHGCFLCRASASFEDQHAAFKRLLVAVRAEQVVVVVNRFPYNNGHLLVAPARHVGSLTDLNRVEHLQCMEWLGRLTNVLASRLHAEGFNIGLNLGRVAGAGLPGHLHWHLVPRWSGDHNFMPVLADTRVIPQSLEALWETLHEALGEPR